MKRVTMNGCWAALIAVGLTAAGTVPAAGAAGQVAGKGQAVSADEGGMWELALDKAVAGGKALTLHLGVCGARIVQCWATVAGDNIAHPADTSALTLVGAPTDKAEARLAGEVKVPINSVTHVYAVDVAAKGKDLAGSFTGSFGATDRAEVGDRLTGQVSARAAAGGNLAIEIDLGKIMRGGNNIQRETSISFFRRNGEFCDANIVSGAGEKGWGGTVDYLHVDFAKDAVTGTLSAQISTKCPTRPGRYTFNLEGKVIGTALLGTAVATNEDWRSAKHRFCGAVTAAPAGKVSPEDAAYTLELDNAIEGAEALKVYMERKGGTFGPAVAIKSAYSPHEVDAAGLKLEAGRLKGEIKLAVNPQGWNSGDRRPVAYVYAIDAAVKGNAIEGTFTGRAVPMRVAGGAAGRIRPWQEVRRANALAGGTDYPGWRGPQANGSSVATGHTLVDSLQDARVVWKSEDKTPDSWNWGGQKGPVGGYSSPVVAGGRVYFFYFQPSGELLDLLTVDKKKNAQKQPWKVDADDVMLCVDAATGRTLWKSVLKDKGLNVGMASAFMTPRVAEGKVYGIGSAGRVYCLDAAGGGLIWESDLGPQAERAEKIRQEAKKEGGDRPRMGMEFCSSPALVDGVVVCNDNDQGLIALDAATGKRLWGPIADCISKTSSPVEWKHGAKSYILAASHTAVCVEPRTGRTMWKHPEVASEGTPAVSPDYIVCGGGGSRNNPRITRSMGLNCHRITPQGAKTAWSLEYNNHVTSPLIYDGHVYAISEEATLCIELETGKIAGSSQFPGVRSCSSMIASDGRVFREHLYQQVYWFKADPKDFRQLGEYWRPPSQAECTTAVITDGRLFLRGKDCLYCYDLRAPSAK
jgi:outer membrane protein assembly factor BamB